MNTTDSENESSEDEFDFDQQFDHTSNILQEIKQDCKSNGTFLFEHTTALDFFLFMQYNPENPIVSYLSEEDIIKDEE